MTMVQRRRTDLSAAAGWALSLTLVGYPVAGLIGSAFDWDSTAASVPFRVGVLVFSVVLLVRSPASGIWLRKASWLKVFTLLYLLRLLWDLGVAGVPGAGGALAFFLITVLLPCMALACVAGELREEQCAQATAILGGTVCFMAVVMYAMDWGLHRSLTEQTRRLSFEAVNPITLGHTAVTTVIAALVLARRPIGSLRIALVFAAIVVALSCLVLSASRGPLLALGVCALGYVLFASNWRMRLLLLGLGVLIGLLTLSNLGDGSELLLRFTDLDEDDSSLERLLLQSNAINQFLASPWLGSAYCELEFLEYPHNLFIETAMALGVVGLMVMSVLVYLAGVQFVRRIRDGETLLPLLLLQYLVAIQFSGSLWGANAFWAMMAVTLAGKLRPQASPMRRRAMRSEQVLVALTAIK